MKKRFHVIVAVGISLSAQFAFAGSNRSHRQRGQVVPPPEELYYADAYADHYGVPRELVHAIIHVESSWVPTATSKENAHGWGRARGLMQLLPSTAENYGVTDPYSPQQNIGGGVHYLADLMREFSDLRLVVAAYYCGSHPIARRGLKYSLPEVTNYVDVVRALYTEELKKEGLYDEMASR